MASYTQTLVYNPFFILGKHYLPKQTKETAHTEETPPVQVILQKENSTLRKEHIALKHKASNRNALKVKIN